MESSLLCSLVLYSVVDICTLVASRCASLGVVDGVEVVALGVVAVVVVIVGVVERVASDHSA